MKRSWPNGRCNGKNKPNDRSFNSNTKSFPITRCYELFSTPVKRQWRPINNILCCVCDCRRQGSGTLYRAFRNILRDYNHNKKTKGNTLIKLSTATRKLNFFYNYRCSMYAPRVAGKTSIRYSFSCDTYVIMGASTFFTAEMIRAF